MQDHPYIRQLFQEELVKWYFQASVGHTCCLLLIHQGLTNREYTVYCKSMPIYSCVCQKILKPTHLCMLFSPLHIALSLLSVLGFACFFTTHYNNCFVLWNVFHNRDRKIPYLPCIKLRMKGISLRAQCRTLRT